MALPDKLTDNSKRQVAPHQIRSSAERELVSPFSARFFHCQSRMGSCKVVESLELREMEAYCIMGAGGEGNAGEQEQLPQSVPFVVGPKVPKHYFVVQGFGQTDEGSGSDPWETDSFELALIDAGIKDFNIQLYSSVIPPQATHVSLEAARPYFKHGSVLECIMASKNGKQGDKITAGIGRMQVRQKGANCQVIGGYAVEYKGSADKDGAQRILQGDLARIFARQFNKDEYEMFDEQYVVIGHEVEKQFGTVLASICFITFTSPIYLQVMREGGGDSATKFNGNGAGGQPSSIILKPVNCEPHHRGKI
ncbi:hypothetical protein L7F22_008596 [Adiantum nelumboides]|nr:hypothetical protein [Adiantum nelumboides]